MGGSEWVQHPKVLRQLKLISARLAHRFYKSNVSVADARQECWCILLKYAPKVDASRGDPVAFLTFVMEKKLTTFLKRQIKLSEDLLVESHQIPALDDAQEHMYLAIDRVMSAQKVRNFRARMAILELIMGTSVDAIASELYEGSQKRLKGELVSNFVWRRIYERNSKWGRGTTAPEAAIS